MTLSPLITNNHLVEWTRRELSVDILVGGVNRKFILLHNVKALNDGEGLQVVGMTGHSFDSPYMRLEKLSTTPFFAKVQIEINCMHG